MASENITEAELWADIDEAFRLPPRLPGDIDALQLSTRYGISDNAARDRMRLMIRTGKWEKLLVEDETSVSRRRVVVRRKET